MRSVNTCMAWTLRHSTFVRFPPPANSYKELRLTRKTLQFHFTGGRGVGAQNHYTVPRKRCTDSGGGPCYEERSSPSLWESQQDTALESTLQHRVSALGWFRWKQEKKHFGGRKEKLPFPSKFPIRFRSCCIKPLLYFSPFPSAHSCTNKIKTLPDPLLSESHPSGWMWGRKETLFSTIGRQQQRTWAPETPTERETFTVTVWNNEAYCWTINKQKQMHESGDRRTCRFQPQRSYLRINSKQARHFPKASTDPCMDISHTDYRCF